jgi:hypothetical protein
MTALPLHCAAFAGVLLAALVLGRIAGRRKGVAVAASAAAIAVIAGTIIIDSSRRGPIPPR